jgi:serine/threonine protein kinase/tetratricopeptide (TPR) repeat protein
MSSESKSENSGLEDTLGLGSKASSEPAPEPETGRRIGPYRLIQVIGEGGMGEVWLAEQLEPRRRVALKVIKAGMDTKQVVARFESERQALALMDHPAIAKVFDGGSTPEGRPYFVMEYVAGVPITEHCDTHKLTTTARLELFAEVCEGVQHAHQKAIIHRDLKPSNILVSLVDGKPQAKIIDFGIAKATGYRLTEKTLFTELGAIIGTPEYMSPEQADLTSQDVDTRTDVYSLGVLLYQLLTGELPLGSKELRSSSYEELRRKLKEVEPAWPSTKLGTLGKGSMEAARNRDTDPGALRHQLEGDLDAITMKALEKERSRRYGTPSEFAADIGRHLRNEVVIARPPSTTYRFGKYLKRHRVGVAVSAGLLALVVAFAVAMGVQARRTALERDRANREREVSDKVSAFLANMLSNLNPEDLGDALWKNLHRRVGTARRSQGAPEEKVATALASLDELLVGVNPTQTAVELLDEQILDRAGKNLEHDMGSEPRIAGSLEYTLGRTYLNLGLYSQAEQHAKRAVELQTQAFGPEFPDTLMSMNALANLFENQGRYPEAEKLHRQTLEARRKVLGSEHLDTLGSMNNLANVYTDQARYPEAEKLYQEALQAERRILGPNHPGTLMTMNNLAWLYEDVGRHDDAEKLYHETLEAERRVLGPDHPETLRSMSNLASVYEHQGRYAEAEKLYRETLGAKRRVLGPEHPDTLVSVSNLAGMYDSEGRYQEAEGLAQEAVTSYERSKLKDSEMMGDALLALGSARAGLKRYPQAEPTLIEGEHLLSTTKGKQHKKSLEALVAMYVAWDKSEPGKGHAAQAAQWQAKLDGGG